MTQTLISLGAAYFAREQYDKSKDAYRKAIKILQKLFGEYRDVGICCLKLGDIYMKEEQTDKALSCYQQGLDIIKAINENDNSIWIWEAYQGLGLGFLQKQRYKEAISSLSDAARLSTQVKDNTKTSETLLYLAIAQFNTGDEEGALENLNEAIDAKILNLVDKAEAGKVQKGIDIVLGICEWTITLFCFTYLYRVVIRDLTYPRIRNSKKESGYAKSQLR